MPAKLRYDTHFENSRERVHANLLVLVFQEEQSYIAYSPALDLSGYGYSDEEAKASFEIALKNFLDITTKKKTLYSELKRMGWKIHGQKLKIVKSPSFDDLLETNQSLARLVEEGVPMRPMMRSIEFADA